MKMLKSWWKLMNHTDIHNVICFVSLKSRDLREPFFMRKRSILFENMFPQISSSFNRNLNFLSNNFKYTKKKFIFSWPRSKGKEISYLLFCWMKNICYFSEISRLVLGEWEAFILSFQPRRLKMRFLVSSLSLKLWSITS